MSSQIIPVDPFDYVVFGGNGDLAERKLLPALYHRDHDGQIPAEARIIGASRSHISDEDYRGFAREALVKHVKPEDLHDVSLERFLSRLHYRQVDATADGGWDDLRSLLDEAGTDRDPGLLPRGRAGALRRDRQPRQREGPVDAELAPRRREAGRPRSGIGARAEPADRPVFRRGSGLPHRPLSRQGDGAEPDGAALRQRALRADLELQPYRPRPDHRRRGSRPRGPCRLLRQGRRAARHGAEPHRYS